MPALPPTIYLIAGCNGAGKTTFAKEFLPKEVKCLRFLNADEMARGLSPLDPSAGAVKGARLLLREVHEAIRRSETFGLESTISGVTYVRLLRDAQERGYSVNWFTFGFLLLRWRCAVCASVFAKVGMMCPLMTFGAALNGA